MSIGREMIADGEFERDQGIERLEASWCRANQNAKNGIWPSKSGDIKVAEMGSDHIRNCISMLERNDSYYKEPYIQMFNAELKRRKENA